jgi:hypothetical protein
MSQFEQRANIKFFIKLDKTGGETGWMMQDVCHEECMSHPCMYKWYRRCKAGQESLEEDEHKGTPVTVRSDVREVICTDCRLTVDAVAEKVVVSHGTCHKMLHDLNMR